MFAHGTKFSIGGVEVGGLENISLPEQSKDDVDLTNHQSQGDREYVPGLREGGTVTLEGQNLPADPGQEACRANYDADNQIEECVITLPVTPAVTYTFDGYVNALGGENPFDDKATFTASIKVASKVVKATAGA